MIESPGMNEASQERLKAAIQDGLPLTARPYADIAVQLGMSEQDVIEQVRHWQEQGVIKRMGLVVRHHALGYCANAMVVWNIPDEHVDAVAEQLRQSCQVTLCYRRQRQLPEWPYNLYCMIHGKSRNSVSKHIRELITKADLSSVPHSVLFSNQQFKQRGGHYAKCAG